MKDDSPITPETRLRTTLGTLATTVAVVAAVVAAWTILRSDVQAHARALSAHEARIKTIEDKVSADHDILIEIRTDLKALRRERGQ